MNKINFKAEREEMVEDDLKARGIKNKRVLDAFRKVPREKFVSNKLQNLAYIDRPLPIGHNVTISQPYIVALMCQLLKPSKQDKILDIGTGSGYQAAILGEICKVVVSIEIIEDLAKQAKSRLETLGYKNIKVICADGIEGFAKKAPYDGIIAAATSSQVPKAWKQQLKPEGKIIMPYKEGVSQHILEIEKTESDFKRKKHMGVRFVPLVNKNSD